MEQQQINKPPVLITSKMPKEKERQYVAFLLYCETNSLTRLMQTWQGILRGSVGEVSGIFKDKLGRLPSERTLERWSSQYRWVERADLKLSEDVEILKKKTSQIRQKRLHIISEVFWDKLQTLRKQMRSGEPASVPELKALWEMMRIEGGESISKQEIVQKINEDEQKPPTPEESELGRAIDQTIKDFYEKRIWNKDEHST
ncbi:MAG: hypothetical protein A2383_01580 [Candidatus Pacebacteria bacterium RIFOXYB1_FULL_39_46]|nr:MAG: hypothetical protein A2383_01580 [Candidatus Pacebacteria bacterium RIFOXYB1_FULL_39_46]OGJ39076.1 MAG: hypothetical protein A2182_02000 [Candidatus Pacebacteria bacterium RIFOXYA1_FULL_38_18]OGJ40225.1 MAG: hypothetical protein A2582_04005 [Candidatus Pacebacteria bacterium RIFOXYD1_FULL_39_27]OGJ40691.1 MAG: hypothetical protein A2411_00170 [Candidatus Pacebacteria bacterium RIFOXYC1_FULL_39_21]